MTLPELCAENERLREACRRSLEDAEKTAVRMAQLQELPALRDAPVGPHDVLVRLTRDGAEASARRLCAALGGAANDDAKARAAARKGGA